MTFDLHQLDDLDWDDAEELLEGYIEAIVTQFANAPEGQACAEQYDEPAGGWADNLISLAYTYEGWALPQLNKTRVEQVLEELFPRKISLLDPDDADSAIPELIAFWQFLQREYQLPAAEEILTYLQGIAPRYKEIINDPARFGMAKSFFASGNQAGFDMTSQEGIESFVSHYNQNIAPKLRATGNSGLFPPTATNQPKGKGFGDATNKPSTKSKKRKKKK